MNASTTDAAPTTIPDDVDLFYDASQEDFSSIEVGRSDPPPTNNNNNSNDQGEDAFYNASDEFFGPSWWFDNVVEEEGNDEGAVEGAVDEGYFWSDDEGVDPGASLYADEESRAVDVASDRENDDQEEVDNRGFSADGHDRPIARPRRRRTARTSASVSVPAQQQEEHVNVTGDLRAPVFVVNHASSELTLGSGSGSVPVSPPIIEVKPVASGVADINLAPPATGIADEDTFIPLAPPIIAVPGVVFLAGTSVAVPDVAAATTSVTEAFPEDPMDIDGPEFSNHLVHGEPMDVDLFPPRIARQLARLFGLSGPSGVVRGSSLPVVRSSRVNTRKSVAVGVRSVRLGVRVGGGVRTVPVRTTLRRRFRLASGRT